MLRQALLQGGANLKSRKGFSERDGFPRRSTYSSRDDSSSRQLSPQRPTRAYKREPRGYNCLVPGPQYHNTEPQFHVEPNLAAISRRTPLQQGVVHGVLREISRRRGCGALLTLILRAHGLPSPPPLTPRRAHQRRRRSRRRLLLIRVPVARRGRRPAVSAGAARACRRGSRRRSAL